MRIIFDLRKVGLGDNGGSSTLIKSGNTLLELGHEVFFVDSMRNQHTWTKLKPEHIIARREKNLPDADAIIATGYKSVFQTLKAPERCGKKFHWIRAWETWQMPENQIVKHILKTGTIKLVNSICLKKKLKKFGINSFIVRPGYDFDKIFPTHLRGDRNEIIIGGLYREGVHGRRKRTEWLFETAKNLKSKYENLRFWLFGSEKKPNSSLVDNYIRRPDISTKNNFYNNVDIWLAPTMSEGLHLPPAEAMMTECPVVATNAELSGVQDYTIHLKTGLVSDNNLSSFVGCVNMLVSDKKLRTKLGKNARKQVLSLGDRVTNMKKLVTLLEDII